MKKGNEKKKKKENKKEGRRFDFLPFFALSDLVFEKKKKKMQVASWPSVPIIHVILGIDR